MSIQKEIGNRENYPYYKMYYGALSLEISAIQVVFLVLIYMNIACSRMYDASPVIQNYWRQFFSVLSDQSSVALYWIVHTGTITELWDRSDLGATFMCGRPFSLAGAKHRILGAPVPINGSKPEYCTYYLVSANDKAQRLEDVLEYRIGWLPEHSQSGFAGPRKDLQRRFGAIAYNEKVKSFETPRDCLAALANGEVDMVPIDSYYFDLLRRHDEDARTAFRIIGATAASPIPLLVARPSMPDELFGRLVTALLSLEPDDGLTNLGLSSFVSVSPSTYLSAYMTAPQ